VGRVDQRDLRFECQLSCFRLLNGAEEGYGRKFTREVNILPRGGNLAHFSTYRSLVGMRKSREQSLINAIGPPIDKGASNDFGML
jgi:hypothetical protein